MVCGEKYLLNPKEKDTETQYCSNSVQYSYLIDMCHHKKNWNVLNIYLIYLL